MDALYFRIAGIEPLLRLSSEAEFRVPTYVQAQKAGSREASADIPPGLWLVGDEGVYLLSNSARPPFSTRQGKREDILYAEGLSPSDAQSHELKSLLFGEHDAVEFIPVDAITDTVHAGAGYLRIELSKEHMDVSACDALPVGARGG